MLLFAFIVLYQGGKTYEQLKEELGEVTSLAKVTAV